MACKTRASNVIECTGTPQYDVRVYICFHVCACVSKTSTPETIKSLFRLYTYRKQLLKQKFAPPSVKTIKIIDN
jgi:hypothetical protein